MTTTTCYSTVIFDRPTPPFSAALLFQRQFLEFDGHLHLAGCCGLHAHHLIRGF